MRLYAVDAEARFWLKVKKTSTCWLWLAKKSLGGYGHFKDEHGRTVMAHRWAYQHFVGTFGSALSLDHLCRVRNCVNPAHLEPCSMRENILRGHGVAAINSKKTHCRSGHAFTAENTKWASRAKRERVCRKCQNKSWRLWWRKTRGTPPEKYKVSD